MAYLAVFAFDECKAYPAGGNVGAETHWRGAGPNPVWFFGDFCFAGLGMVTLDVHAFR